MPPLPDIRQTDDFRCGEKVAQVVFQVLGVRPRIIAVANPLDGTHPATLMAVFRAAGLSCLTGEASLDMLRAFTRLGLPVVTLVQKEGEGHWVVVGDVKRGRVYYQCPVDGPCSEPVAAFEERWHDVDGWGTAYRRFVIVPSKPGGG